MKINKKIVSNPIDDPSADKISEDEARATLIKDFERQIQECNGIEQFYRCVEISQARNEDIIQKKEGEVTLYGIPVSNKEFYFEPGKEPEERFTIDDVEYIEVFRDEASVE